MKDNIVHIDADNKMKDQASVWLAKLDRGLSVEEKACLKTWLGQSDAHREYFLKLAKQWDVLSVLSQLSDVVPYHSQEKPSHRLKYYLAAASVLFICILSIPMLGIDVLFKGNSPIATELANNTTFSKTYQTIIGEKSTIYLPDASILTLNTDSIVEVKYTLKQRLLLLKKGELFIDVAHNKQRELIVSAGSKSFVAVGTAFNVSYLAKSELELIVTEGKVVIANKEDIDDTDYFAQLVNTTTPVGVTAGERVVLESKGKLLTESIKKVNIEKSINSSLSWRQGKLIFQGETLDKVIEEVARYSNIKITLEGEEIKNIKIGGRFRTGDVDGLLNILTEQFNIETRRTSHSRIELHLIKSKKSV